MCQVSEGIESLNLILLMCSLTLTLSMLNSFVQNSIATKAKKCTSNLSYKMKENHLNVETTLSLFHTNVSAFIHYGCKVLGFHESPIC